MFCKFCYTQVTAQDEQCPHCKQSLDNSTRLINPPPAPKTVEEPKADTESDTVGADVEVVQDVPDDAEEVAEYAVIDGASVVRLDVSYDSSSDVSDTISDTEDPQSYDYQPTPIVEEPDKRDDEFLEEPPITQKRIPFMAVGIGIIVVIALIIIVLLTQSNKRNSAVKDTNSTTVASSEEQNATPATKADAGLNKDSLVVSKTLTINDVEKQGAAVSHYSTDDQSKDVTEYTVKLSKEEVQRYTDEQEVKYQMGDSEVKAIRYLDSIFCYQYDGMYQYGLYNGNTLYVFEISNAFEIAVCDNLAMEYFCSRVKGVKTE